MSNIRIHLIVRTPTILILFFLSASANLWPLCFRINEQVRSNYSQSEVVFVGKVLSRRAWIQDEPVLPGDETSKDDEDGAIFYKVQLKEMIKGNLPAEFVVKTINASGRVWLDAGKTYLLFASREDLKGGGKTKHYWLHEFGCRDPNEFSLPGANDKVKEAKDVRQAAENHGKAKIGVRVLRDEAPMSGKHFSLKGEGLKKAGVTGNDGWLWFEVPAGHYEAESKDDGVVEQIFEEKRFSFDVPEGGGWDCVFVDKNR